MELSYEAPQKDITEGNLQQHYDEENPSKPVSRSVLQIVFVD